MEHVDTTHHPGPPRFVTVGDSVELAPRRPDPEASFRWTLVDRPDGSEAVVGDGPVVHLAPDEPGTYRLTMDAPDGAHEQTVRAFPDPRRPARFAVDAADLPESFDRLSVIGPFNDHTLARDRPEKTADGYALDVSLPPGKHYGIFAVDDGFEDFYRAETTVEGPGRPRVRLDASVDGDEVVVRADATAAPDGGDPDVEFSLDGRDSLARERVHVDGDELRVALDALPDAEPVRIHAVAVAERHSVADTLVLDRGGVSDENHSVALAVSRPSDPPAWLRDATMYEIFVRAFAGETPAATFDELERRVPYLESLGVDCVWLTPVLASPTDHGYHVTDFFETAADLGSREAFESFVARCRGAGIRVVFDLVINHTSRDHPAFQLHSAGVDAYADYYPRVADAPDEVDWAGGDAPGYYFNWTHIPNLNYDSLAVRRWMLDVVEEWAGVVDGFRCDVAWGVPHGFWKEVRQRVKAENAEFVLLDETIPRDPDYHENEFDFHYDTALYYALRDVGTGDEPATALFDALADTERRGFPDDSLLMRYVENHDETRYATECDEASLRAAAAATFTLPGVPMVYYGQERGVPEQRGTMRWHDGNAALTDYHRNLARAREDYSALRAEGVDRIRFAVADADGVDTAADAGNDDSTDTPADRIVAYARGGGADRLVVVLNFGADPQDVTLDAAVDAVDLVSGEDVGVGAGIGVDTADAEGSDSTATSDGQHVADSTTVRVADAVVLRAAERSE